MNLNFLRIFSAFVTSYIKSLFNNGSLEVNLLSALNIAYIIKEKECLKILRKINYYRLYQSALSEKLSLLNNFNYSVSNLDVVSSALKNGNGLFIVTISTGINVELFFYLAKQGYKVNFIFNEKSNLDGFQKSIEEEKKRVSHEHFNASIILLDSNQSETMIVLKKIIESLSSNEIILFMIDNISSKNKSGKAINYNFLGMEMQESVGLLEIAKRYKTPIIPAVSTNIHFCKTNIDFYEKPIYLNEENKNTIQSIFDFFSEHIIKHPEQWLNWHSIKKYYRDQLKKNYISDDKRNILYKQSLLQKYHLETVFLQEASSNAILLRNSVLKIKYP